MNISLNEGRSSIVPLQHFWSKLRIFSVTNLVNPGRYPPNILRLSSLFVIFPHSSEVKQSVFETNPLLLEKEATLIEYAAFFGSIKIFQYLKNNHVQMTPSLWIYAIHSKNAELINILEESCIDPPDKSYLKCFEESIKCHHNEIAD